MDTHPIKQLATESQSFRNISSKVCIEKEKPSFITTKILSLVSMAFYLSVSAQTFPPGFTMVRVTTNESLSYLTAMAFAPDGRIFMTQQDGVVRIFKNGSLLHTPFLQINVQATGERGLVGIALDPDFPTNQYVYLYYTLPDGSRNRISRFTANGDIGVAGSELVILNLEPLRSATVHNGGAMHFGPDGKLYVAIGDNRLSTNSQNLDTYNGKLLRINKDGSVPPGNPFTGSPQKSRVWAYGLRNPFTFGFQPGTGKLFVNDVGEVSWEEINDATVGGKNFGWPQAEGNSTNQSFSNPAFTYPHGRTGEEGCAITGGTFFNPSSTNYPAQYWGGYFFMDFCNGWIDFLDLSGPAPIRVPFAKDLGASKVYLSVGTDGNLYYLVGRRGLHKIVYTTNSSPAIQNQPDDVSVSAGQPATFSVTATGSTPLSYQWRKNGTVIANATSASFTIASTGASDAGAYSVMVSNAYGSVVSNNAQLTVTSSNQPPQPTILTPTEGTLYRGGDTIRFSGSATDAEDGNLPSSAFSWTVDFHHDTHIHDGPPVAQGVKSGYFVIPRSGETSDNVWYRLILTVTDSKGLQNTAYRDVLPRKSVITLNTQPSGLQVILDGQTFSAPISVTGVEGIEREIGAVSQQSSGIKIYDFDKWLHRGAAMQTIITPINDVTYTAVYKESLFSATKLEAESAQLSGAVFSSIHAGYAGSGFVDYINASGDYIEWTLNAIAAGNYELSFRYALMQGTRNLQIQVNGATVNSSLYFPATGNWTTWSDVSLSVALNAGANKIRATAIGRSGPNMDYIIVTPQTLQAENATLSGAKVAINHAGYTGTGFVDFINRNDDYTEWSVYKQTAGAVSLNFRYANGSLADRPMQVRVNGIVISSNLSFPVTGGWNQWSNATITANFNPGINTIRLMAIGNSGPNVDCLSWSSSASSAAQTNVIVLSKAAEGQVEQGQELSVFASPNPATGTVRLQVNRLSNLPVSVSIINTSGKVCRSLAMKEGLAVLQLSLKDLPAGLYLIVAEQGSRRTTTKLVVN